jgi:hypothetical protein
MAPYRPPEQIFDEAFPRQVQRAILRVTTMGFHEAHRSVRQRFDYYAGHDLLPYERRAYVENNLLGLAKRYKLTRPTPQLNKARNSFHVELLSGGCVLTASAVESRGEMVRHAIFRETLARHRQGQLFNQEPDAAPGATLYGIILYGAPDKDDNQSFPGFVVVAFPDRFCERYVSEVDLMSRFRAEHAEHVQVLLRRRRDLA